MQQLLDTRYEGADVEKNHATFGKPYKGARALVAVPLDSIGPIWEQGDGFHVSVRGAFAPTITSGRYEIWFRPS